MFAKRSWKSSYISLSIMYSCGLSISASSLLFFVSSFQTSVSWPSRSVQRAHEKFAKSEPQHKLSRGTIFRLQNSRFDGLDDDLEYEYDNGDDADAALDAKDSEYFWHLERAREFFQPQFDFPLDEWQLQAGSSLLQGKNVIVCAPTGSGKTVVGEMAIRMAMTRMQDRDSIYTTPLKALSNQKYLEFRAQFGFDQVGLSTGDISINRDARVMVMTTEVYRNMAWRSSSKNPEDASNRNYDNYNDNRSRLERTAVVVLDEFHYMGMPGRGGVWEECVVFSQLPQLVGLSATLSNAPQLVNWMAGVTGRETVLVEAPGKRPVPLRYLFATREGLFPLFRNPDAGPGAPLGLLGYRGDGEPEEDDENNVRNSKLVAKKSKKIRNRNSKRTDELEVGDLEVLTTSSSKLPRGLEINPALVAAAQRRIQRVNRMLERQQAQIMERRERQYEEEGWDFGGRGRGRKAEERPLPKTKLSPREERRERERLLKSEMRKAVPSIPILLTRLNEKNLLPAIFFIFSRAGCDQAAQTVARTFLGPRSDPNKDEAIEYEGDQGDDEYEYGLTEFSRKALERKMKNLRGYSTITEDSQGRMFRSSSNNAPDDAFKGIMADVIYDDLFSGLGNDSPLASEKWPFYCTAGLLTAEQVEIVARRIAQFSRENEEIPFSKDVMEQYLLGIGSHHAGMLPAHKSFVEHLYQSNLMKAVFATETLAAGINMPARTTVICALAKRSDGGSMKLLETSNLLQMSGRAGRRGMDLAGTCVIVATPFESHEDASAILTDPIQPIASQFRPSYTLAVNLVARGNGKLDVANELINKSFAMWEKRRLREDLAARDGIVGDVLEASSQERFVSTLVTVMQNIIDIRSAKYDVGKVQMLQKLFKDQELLKETSKSYLKAAQIQELEQTTLAYLEQELKDMMADGTYEEDELLNDLLTEDEENVMAQINEQRRRAIEADKNLKRHPFSRIVRFVNRILQDEGDEYSSRLATALREAREASSYDDVGPLTGAELSIFSKSSIVMKRKLRKMATTNPDLDPDALLQQVAAASSIKENDDDGSGDGAWITFLAMVKVLVAYGCLEPVDRPLDVEEGMPGIQDRTFSVTVRGIDVGMLGFDNSLWCFVAMGGAWDVVGASAELDRFLSAMNSFEDDDISELFADGNDKFVKELFGEPSSSPSSAVMKQNVNDSSSLREMSNVPPSQAEAEQLVSHLIQLSPEEMAGYVSCLVSEGSRSGNPSSSIMDMFSSMTARQQRTVQSSLAVMERLEDVQRRYRVGNGNGCSFDIAHCEVVTAWASGARTWSEVVELSGMAPGDLVRVLSRAMDAVRQLGNLKYAPLRKGDMDGIGRVFASRGIHPKVRRLCREAAVAMNRYPVKDPLPFEVGEEEAEMFEDEGDDDDYPESESESDGAKEATESSSS